MNRLKPFLVLLDAHYLPLLFLALPQAYTVGVWLNSGRYGNIPVAIIGALAFEMAYVSAIAWSAKRTRWFWITTFTALVFSVAVAIRVYWQDEGWLSVLHAGFPLVGFCYTMVMHSAPSTEKKEPLVSITTPAADGTWLSEKEQILALRASGDTWEKVGKRFNKSEGWARKVANG